MKWIPETKIDVSRKILCEEVLLPLLKSTVEESIPAFRNDILIFIASIVDIDAETTGSIDESVPVAFQGYAKDMLVVCVGLLLLVDHGRTRLRWAQSLLKSVREFLAASYKFDGGR